MQNTVLSKIMYNDNHYRTIIFFLSKLTTIAQLYFFHPQLLSLSLYIKLCTTITVPFYFFMKNKFGVEKKLQVKFVSSSGCPINDFKILASYSFSE
jgi:hypothetical protein